MILKITTKEIPQSVQTLTINDIWNRIGIYKDTGNTTFFIIITSTSRLFVCDNSFVLLDKKAWFGHKFVEYKGTVTLNFENK